MDKNLRVSTNNVKGGNRKYPAMNLVHPIPKMLLLQGFQVSYNHFTFFKKSTKKGKFP